MTKVQDMLESKDVREDIDLIMRNVRGAVCDAWYAGYTHGLEEGERIWRPKVPDER